MEQPAPDHTPIFQRIKDYLLEQIAAGHWKEGDVIPSEQALTKQFGVSRMTVNRAVRELTAEQVLTRRQGSGTFVAQQKYQATLLEIKSIAEEVRARGHAHRSSLQQLERGKASELLAKQFDLAPGHLLFHSVIVHYENGVPIQVEDRWVNPLCAPDYMEQDFAHTTPNEYLMAAAPLQGATYSIEALAPPRDIADMLAIDTRQPCLVLRRQTRSAGRIASLATMWHPGHRYQFAGSFT
ncbi:MULTISPECIES: histidine utilization repressor [unclassified Massilia]|uniref:histidine utilization repressor n=1 Tax=unclassified Massilia TaxID=2609279 RepID=UPI00067BBFCC|nr:MULTISPECIES: histidine utilization repressor [unclassified Massilia]AKU23796.1 histidine utilization repressor [Massilia sp. NR 4-1]UMR31265.1 histidine utilization repressor [Massilia sp. MB5]UTY57775.1 histidine utilization repressor [Massilia sp. erpn]